MMPLTSIASPNLTTLKPPENQTTFTTNDSWFTIQSNLESFLRKNNAPFFSPIFNQFHRSILLINLGRTLFKIEVKNLPLGRWTFRVALSMGVGDPWGGVFLPPPLPCTPPPPPAPSPTPVLIPSWLYEKRRRIKKGLVKKSA